MWVLNWIMSCIGRKPVTAVVDPFDILVVDDEPLIVDLLKDILQDYRVETANSGEQAWSIISEHRGAVKLVIADYNMGGMTGVQLFRMIKGAYPDIKRVLCSGSLSEEDLFLYNDNYHEAVAKPFTVDGIKSLVDYMLSKDYVPKTAHTNELRRLVSRITEPPPPEVQNMLVKLVSMGHVQKEAMDAR